MLISAPMHFPGISLIPKNIQGFSRGSGLRGDITPAMENQTEKKMANDIDRGVCMDISHIRRIAVLHSKSPKKGPKLAY